MVRNRAWVHEGAMEAVTAVSHTNKKEKRL